MLRKVKISMALCCGLCGEVEIPAMLPVLPLDVSCVSMVDHDADVREYLVRRFGQGDHHILKTLIALAQPRFACGACSNHGGVCRYETGGGDVAYMGVPCQPFSTAARWKELPERHPLHSAIFGGHYDAGAIKICDAKKPRVVIMENVYGMDMKRKSGVYRDESPLTCYIKRMQGIRDWDGTSPLYTGTAIVKQTSVEWTDASRPRNTIVFYIVSPISHGFCMSRCVGLSGQRVGQLEGVVG